MLQPILYYIKIPGGVGKRAKHTHRVNKNSARVLLGWEGSSWNKTKTCMKHIIKENWHRRRTLRMWGRGLDSALQSVQQKIHSAA